MEVDIVPPDDADGMRAAEFLSRTVLSAVIIVPVGGVAVAAEPVVRSEHVF